MCTFLDRRADHHMKTLTAHGLACHRGGRPIFERLNFSLHEGEMLRLEGRNGSGKTSLLKIIAGFLPVLKDQLSWQGGGHPSPDSHFIGFKAGVRPYLTVSENLAFWGSLYGAPSKTVNHTLELFELEGLRDFPAEVLSSGQTQRLSLARLRLLSKKIWLLDEPMIALDGEGRALLDQLFEEHLNQGGLILMATHEGTNETEGARALNLETFAPVFSGTRETWA